MTLHNAWTPAPLPADEPLPKTIKAAAFSELTETEVKALRTYSDTQDPRIEPGEVFYYGAHVQTKRPEGDDFADHRQESAGAGEYDTNGRRADNQLVQTAPGKLEAQHNKLAGAQVYWLDPTTSPNEIKLVAAKLI